jgi:hypothetical protein
MYVISDAHIHGVTSITTTSDCKKIVSGGSEVIFISLYIGRSKSLEDRKIDSGDGSFNERT